MSEPTTVVTDYLLAVLALAVAFRLWAPRAGTSAAGRLWAAGFVALAVAAIVGGTWHAIPDGSWPAVRHTLWSVTYVGIGVVDLLILAGATRAVLTPPAARVLLLLLTVRFLVYTGLVVSLREFRYVALEFGGTVLLLLAFALYLARRGDPAARFVLGGALLSLLGGLVLWLRVSLHPSFNNNDLYHVIQAGGLWLYYRAARLLPDAGRPRRAIATVGAAAPEPVSGA
jgi:hypothetical protein